MKQSNELVIILFKNSYFYETVKSGIMSSRRFSAISLKSFLDVAVREMKNLSRDEAANLYEYIRDRVTEEEESLGLDAGDEEKAFDELGRKNPAYEQGLRIFDALLASSIYFLDERGAVPLCRHEHMLEWRKASHELDQDLYITAFLAYKDIINPMRKRNFFWKPVISSDNMVLHRLLSRGISENHFHLNGSSQYFQLSWVNIMNYPENTGFRAKFDQLDKLRLNEEYNISPTYSDSLYIRCLKAAAIRLFLFYFITPELKVSAAHEKSDEQSMIKGEQGTIKDKRSMIEKIQDIKYIKKILFAENYEAEMLCQGIEACTSSVSDLDPCAEMDYARYHIKFAEGINEYFSGERFLMYSVFKKIYSAHSDPADIFDLFYAYILLKESLREEIIQTNNVIGFANFDLIQSRKEYFVENTPLEGMYKRTAILDTLRNQPMIKSLEARITPKATALLNYKSIVSSDSGILKWAADLYGENSDEVKTLPQKFFYVMHFIKSNSDTSWLYVSDLCRNQKVRETVKMQTLALIDFRNHYPEAAARVRGIDAANTEIGCRPEVFAQAFRTLREHEVDQGYADYYYLPRLGITYHVGEDFVDIIDGLRAIDECILFLNMRGGDRLGHALALGADVESWYGLKRGKISISQQDYLDNIVWIYFKIIEFEIDVDSSLMAHLNSEYYKYFRIIYKDYVSHSFKTADGEAKETMNFGSVEFNISTYYDAWKLRGDDPSIYSSGDYRNPQFTGLWDWNCINKIYPEDRRIRKSKDVVSLYHAYHFNSDVKTAGNKKIQVEIPENLRSAVKKVQKKMQQMIAEKGLCIETNLSSNCLIGTFGKYSYEKHPILKFYNWGLGEADTAEKCYQLSVCINTDDQAVFGTSLENEYALMVCALDSLKSKDGLKRYSINSIYEWIDNIRQMGNDYVFRNDCENEQAASK